MTPAAPACRLFVVLAAFFALIAAPPAQAIISVDINRGNVNPLPVAIPEFIAVANALTDVGTVEELGRNVAAVIEADLERSGLFAPIPHAAFISLPATADIRPRFANWRTIGAQALVVGQVIPEADGRLRFEFRLWDVLSETYMIGNRYIVLPQTWRRVAHLIADDIYERLTGEKGYFDTRIVYVSETGPKSKRVKRLAIMDQDGANNRFL
ncbi:MAG TPA: Tol-Pal system protein TolB, partial [Sphingomonadales bacterium]|nr:Tol-Pal system protein TolB [Sphingomonadales bacterium]